MPTELSRQWFISGEGIDRHVISADIQRYLGNDATVRPGVGTNEHQGVQGFWIKAYRNLTNAMIEDLKADSARWRQEQRQTGTRGSQSPYYKSDVPGAKIPDPFSDTYERSVTYRNSSAGHPHNIRRNTESPSIEVSPYGVQPPSRMPQDNRMQIDQPGPQPARPYSQDRTGYQSGNQPYPDNRPPFPSDGRQNYPMDTPMQSGSYRPQGGQPYPQDPRYVNYAQGNDSAQPQGFRPPPNFYVPASSSYDSASSMATSRPDPSPYGNGPYQPPPPGRDPRDQRYQQPDFGEGRYAYPSPAATTIGVNSARDSVTSPPQSNSFGQGPPARPYDPYGNPRNQYR